MCGRQWRRNCSSALGRSFKSLSLWIFSILIFNLASWYHATSSIQHGRWEHFWNSDLKSIFRVGVKLWCSYRLGVHYWGIFPLVSLFTCIPTTEAVETVRQLLRKQNQLNSWSDLHTVRPLLYHQIFKKKVLLQTKRQMCHGLHTVTYSTQPLHGRSGK